VSAAFTFESADDRALSLGAYLLGVIELALIVVPLAYAAWRLRAALLPGWTGALGRLVEVVVALVIVTWLAELLGTVGAFRLGWMIVGAVAIAVAAMVAAPRFERPGSAPPAPGHSRLAFWLAGAACAAVAAAWMVPTLASLAGGMDRADTLWYHMPLSARFVQSGELGEVFNFDPIFFAAYYPDNSEVLHAVPMLAFDRDILSPLLNLGFVVLGLLAAWCVGRPYGLAPQAMLGGAIALGAQHLVEFQAGEALNDIGGTSLVLAAGAVLVNAHAAGVANGTTMARLPLAVAGLAAGLAAGTKLSFLAPVAGLAIGVLVIERGWRWRALMWFAIPAALAGGYWYVRNLVAVGNPIPFTPWGPLGLPSPERTFELREPFSVAHYLTDFDVISDWFVPGLNESFGVLWPLTLVAMIGVGILAVWRGGEPVLRMLGAVVLLTLVAYVFTPLTAAGEEGEPIAFEWNVRYMAPAAAIAFSILPCLPDARRDARSRALALGGLAVLCVATIASLVQWQQGHAKGAALAGVLVAAGFVAITILRDRGLLGSGAPRRWGIGVAAIAVIGALGAGWWEQNHYLDRRYENLSPDLRLANAVRWARDLRDARVAIGGVRGVFNQYPFYGTDLSNRVQWLGADGDEGAFLRIPTCEGWREEVNEGGYTHVVTTYDPFNVAFDSVILTNTKEALWTRRDPATRQVLRDGPVAVFEITGPLDPAGCDGLPALSEAELNGNSVNIRPTANQPGPPRRERQAVR
jgi:hypothetical protein